MKTFQKINNLKEYQKIKNEPILIITLPIALLFIIIILAVRPFLLLRIGLIHSDRIGHFVLNTELFLCEKKYFKKKNICDFFYFPTVPCNFQIAKMIKRKLIILPKVIARPFDLIFRKFDFFADHRTLNINGDYDVKNLIDKIPSQIVLTNEEIKKGNKILKNRGIDINRKFISVIARDSAYLKDTKRDFSYHDHRDDNIKNYEKAILYLARKGYVVLRMGKKTHNKLSVKHKNIIDYSFGNFKSDFMDVFLAHKTYFGITNLTGYDALFVMFRKPMLCLGSLPIGCMYSSSKNYLNTIYHHYSTKLKRNLTLTEIFKIDLAYEFNKNIFFRKKIKIIKFKPKEILDYTKDMIIYLKNKNKYRKNKLNIKANQSYEKSLIKYKSETPYHGKIRSSFCKSYLKKYSKIVNN